MPQDKGVRNQRGPCDTNRLNPGAAVDEAGEGGNLNGAGSVARIAKRTGAWPRQRSSERRPCMLVCRAPGVLGVQQSSAEVTSR